MANVGTLTIALEASLAKFQQDLGKATKYAEQSANQISKAFGTVRHALELIGVAVSVKAFVGLVKGSIDAADHLQDLAQKTGVSVEALGGIGFAAKQAGTDLDSVAKGLGKFNLAIAKAAGGDEDAAKAFGKLGISITQLKTLKTEELFAKAADGFAKFADGPNKAAIANATFGKAYQELIPLLNEGGETLRQNIAYYQKYSGVTKELAEQSDKFNDEVEKAKLLTGAFGNALAANLLPSLQALVELFVEAKEKGGGFKDLAGDIADGLRGIAVTAVGAATGISVIGKSLGAFAAATAALVRGEASLASGILKEGQSDVDRAFSRAKQLIDAINTTEAKAGKGIGKPKPAAESLGSKDADAANKAILDQRIKALDDLIKSEEELLKNRQKFLDIYYHEDLLSIRDYFAGRQNALDEAFDKESKAYDDEIAAVRKFQKTASAKERIEAETKVADIIAKQSKARRDYATQGTEDWIKERIAVRDFTDSIDELQNKFAQLSGNSVAAGLFDFEKANRKFRQQAEAQAASSDPGEQARGQRAVKAYDQLRTLTGLQLELNDAQKSFSDTLVDVGILQTKINQEQQSGAITEIDAMNKRAALAQNYIGILQQELRAYADLAASLPAGAARNDALRNVQRLQTEIDALAVSADELANKFRGIFTDSLAAGLADVVTGTKSVKDAFRDMERSIVQSITRIASQNIAESIFGKGGAGGGIGGLFAQLFGGFGGGGGGGLGQIFQFGRASGGPVSANQSYIVGERGPELFRSAQAGNIVPNHVLSSMRTQKQNNISISVNVMPGASRTTADQAALQTGAAVQRALNRNG